MPDPAVLDRLQRRTPEMIEALAALVGAESPSPDVTATAACAKVVGELGERLLGQAPEVLDAGGVPHVRWRFGAAHDRRVLIVGHFDTVWPVGTLARWPFTVDAGVGTATGPGAFDMKAGIVQAFEALATLDSLDGVEILLTSDEETGSLSSRELIEDAGRAARAALVFEPAAGGALKVGRKGTGMYTLRIAGRPAHAGLEPEKGANALVELSHLVLGLGAIQRPDLGTTVTPTMAASGTATNVVPAAATLEVDVRVAEPGEDERVDAEVRALAATGVVPGTSVTVSGGLNRPPLPESAARGLWARAAGIAERLGVRLPDPVVVGGGSDGNLTAAVGCPTLDGLGAVGDGAHAEGEHIVVAAMAERSALAAALIADLLDSPPDRLF